MACFYWLFGGATNFTVLYQKAQLSSSHCWKECRFHCNCCITGRTVTPGQVWGRQQPIAAAHGAESEDKTGVAEINYCQIRTKYSHLPKTSREHAAEVTKVVSLWGRDQFISVLAEVWTSKIGGGGGGWAVWSSSKVTSMPESWAFREGRGRGREAVRKKGSERTHFFSSSFFQRQNCPKT